MEKTVNEVRNQIEALRKENADVSLLIDSLSTKGGFRVFLYGGALRDMLLHGKMGSDLDFFVVSESVSPESVKMFRALLQEFASQRKGIARDFENSHIEVSGLPSKVQIDVHYPAPNSLSILARSDFTINGIGFDLKSSEFCDPLGGIADLEKRLLRIHSPSFAITNPKYFPRYFRLAAALGFELSQDVRKLIADYGHMVSMSDGRSSPMILVEVLRLLSLEDPSTYVEQMVDLKLLSYILPELTPILTSSRGRDNLRRIAASKESLPPLSAPIHRYLQTPWGRFSGMNELGIVRFFSLFESFGLSYCEMNNAKTPYMNSLGELDEKQHEKRFERNILSYMASRYSESPEFQLLFRQIPAVLECAENLRVESPFENSYQAWKSKIPSDTLFRAVMLAYFSLAGAKLNPPRCEALMKVMGS